MTEYLKKSITDTENGNLLKAMTSFVIFAEMVVQICHGIN
jgi:hypothetical protein